MSTGRFTRAGTPARGFDWTGIERSPAFEELVRKRRRFLVPVSIVFFAIVAAYLLLVSFAHGLMSKQVAGLPLSYVAALSQVLLTWVVTWLYLRKADSTFAPLERRVSESVSNPEREVQR
jgi:uncharacterized membrane protein (DUF485 family)